MANQVTRRCHWVPQAYLRTFACDEKRQRIWRFSKNDGDPEMKRIDKVAVRHHLYAPKAADGTRDDSLEKKLADLEDFLGREAWQLVCHDFVDLTCEPMRKMIALIAATMWLRTPRQFETWKSIHRQLVDFIGSGDKLPDEVGIGEQVVPVNPEGWETFRDADEEDLKRNWNRWVGSSREVAELMLEMRWAVLFSEEPVFITSDNPVMVGDTLGPHRGLKHPETIVTFPLSPTRILMLDNRHSEPDAQYYPRKFDPGSTNSLIWRNATEHMFSSRHPDTVCAEIVADAERMGFV